MTTTNRVAPWIAAAAIAASFGFAPIAGAATEQMPVIAATTTQPAPGGTNGTDPLVPFGADPQIPYQLGFIDHNHDNGNTTNGQLDLPS
ncbi:hypothetical protein [Mycolicibacterium komossense]|uniref:Uncharacterized protein n=1 Tax=Mycolicibacterium komossense TaxID=1779 RepID=A0ABT3C4W6_9MYCO|nr:hypothetical protein [Mycolicibacterium komossense]MCV7224523.1 hypothetical protein [Mycolicibacterium komossense]